MRAIPFEILGQWGRLEKMKCVGGRVVKKWGGGGPGFFTTLYPLEDFKWNSPMRFVWLGMMYTMVHEGTTLLVPSKTEHAVYLLLQTMLTGKSSFLLVIRGKGESPPKAEWLEITFTRRKR